MRHSPAQWIPSGVAGAVVRKEAMFCSDLRTYFAVLHCVARNSSYPTHGLLGRFTAPITRFDFSPCPGRVRGHMTLGDAPRGAHSSLQARILLILLWMTRSIPLRQLRRLQPRPPMHQQLRSAVSGVEGDGSLRVRRVLILATQRTIAPRLQRRAAMAVAVAVAVAVWASAGGRTRHRLPQCSRCEGASFASVKLDAPPVTVDDLRAAIMAARRMDVDPSLVTLRLVHLGPGGRKDDEPTAAEEAAAATLKPRSTLAKAGVSDGAFLLLNVASTAAAGPALLPPDDDTARLFAALAEGLVAEEAIARPLPDGTQRPITVLRLPDCLKWKHADSNVMLVRHFYDDLYTHVLRRLQPQADPMQHRHIITGNPGAHLGRAEGVVLARFTVANCDCFTARR